VVRRDIINAVIDQLHANEAKPAHLSHKIAQHDRSFYYDTADQERTATEIPPDRWEPCYDPPPVFITNSLQAEQAEPDQRATIPDISKFADLLSIPDDRELLTVVWLISTFIPKLKTPILYIYGEKGSGKTSLEKALLKLADPTVTDPITQDVNVLDQPPNREVAITHLQFSSAICQI
jgi:ABC-type glutathione transport system ATPase component